MNAHDLAGFYMTYHAMTGSGESAKVEVEVEVPAPIRACIVTEEVRRIRGHADIRIARRAQTISRLAQVISERQVNIGLRQTLVTQARRLEHLANHQFKEWGGVAAVPTKAADEVEGNDEAED